MKAFVYGTLKRKESNHGLLTDAKFIGRAKTADSNYFMCHNGSYPYVCNGDSRVVGELFEIDDNQLKRMDYLEGVPTHYERFEREFLCNGKKETAYVYMRIDPNIMESHYIKEAPRNMRGDYFWSSGKI